MSRTLDNKIIKPLHVSHIESGIHREGDTNLRHSHFSIEDTPLIRLTTVNHETSTHVNQAQLVVGHTTCAVHVQYMCSTCAQLG